MMEIVSTKDNTGMVVFTIGNQVHFTTLERFNPNLLDARSPKFQGSFNDAVNYCHSVL